MKIEHKIFEAEVKAFDDENLIVENFISTEHKDRGGDIMRAKGMKIVGKPVVLLLHGRGPMGSEPVGKPLSITIDEFKGQPGILARTQFFNDETGQRLYQKIKGGFIPNWSIGYSVDEAKDLLREGRYDGRDVTKWQLFEYSPVGVPMNPFAQTVKEFLDKNEDPKGPFEVPESHWFGLVDAKECKGCGQGCDKHKPGECSTCKAEVVVFTKDGAEIGKACEKCQPEEFKRLATIVYPPPVDEETKDSCATCGKILWKEWSKEFPYQAVKVYCKAGCEIVVKASDPMEARMVKMETMMASMDARCKKMEDAMGAMADAMKALTGSLKNLEPILTTLPPEPDGGGKGDGDEGNPPEPETPPRLIFKGTAQEKEEAARIAKEQRASVVAAVATAMKPLIDAQADRLMGRVN
jgi:hypothetical protein